VRAGGWAGGRACMRGVRTCMCCHTCTCLHMRVHTTRACTHARMHACTHARMHACTHAHIHTHRTAFSQAKGAPKRDQEDKTLSRAGARELGGGERTSVDGARAPASVSPIALPSSTAVAHLKRSWSSSVVHGFPLRAHASMAASPSPGASVTTRSSPTLGELSCSPTVWADQRMGGGRRRRMCGRGGRRRWRRRWRLR